MANVCAPVCVLFLKHITCNSAAQIEGPHTIMAHGMRSTNQSLLVFAPDLGMACAPQWSGAPDTASTLQMSACRQTPPTRSLLFALLSTFALSTPFTLRGQYVYAC
jgi:hypothetical protein